MNRFSVAIAAVALSATAGCYPYWFGTALEDRVLALENASAENRAQIDEVRRALDVRLTELEETLQRMTRSATKTTAEVAAATDELLRQVQQLRGQVAEDQFRFGEFLQRYEQLETQVAALGGKEALDRLEARKSLSAIDRPADRKQFFALAKSYHDRGEREIARALFNEYIEKWKFDEEAPRAQLLIGDSYFDEKNYRAALAAYQKLYDTWPRSKYLPDALYKLGLSFQQLGLKDEARAFYEEAAKYSGQEAGKLARKKLQEMRGGAGRR